MGFESLSVYRMKMRNLMTCVGEIKSKFSSGFNVYGTFYSHLFDRVIQQMATHQHHLQKCNKNRITAIAFGKHHLAPLIAWIAGTLTTKNKYIRALHQTEVIFQMKRFKPVRVSRFKPKHVTKLCNLFYKVCWVRPVDNQRSFLTHSQSFCDYHARWKMHMCPHKHLVCSFLTVLLCVHRHHPKTVISCWTWEKTKFPRSAQCLWFTI